MAATCSLASSYQDRFVVGTMDYTNLESGAKVCGGYSIVKKLKSSPLRETYEAVHDLLGRRVAIKFCLNEAHREAFVTAAQLMGRLDHPYIADLYDAGYAGDIPYIVTEFIGGDHLGELLGARHKLDLTTTLRLMQQVAEAIHFAHTHHVLHRNITPQNIVIDQLGRAVLTDFELACECDTIPQYRALTPNFMAPEQAQHETLTVKTDVWGIGATLYWALTGRSVPYAWTEEELQTALDKGTALEACARFLETRRPIDYSHLNDNVPKHVVRLIQKCLDYDPEDRWYCVENLGRAIESAISQTEVDSTSATITFSVPTEGQSIVAYTETHADELAGDYRQFEIRRTLGQGQFGIVYEALSTYSGQDVAIKFLKTEHLSNEDAIRRFKKESKLLSGIHHPNVVRVLSQGRYGPTFFIAMELLDPLDLKAIIESKGRLSVEQSLDYASHLMAGLQCLHDMDITHRDLKPANIGFCKGRLVLSDFGLAREVDETQVTRAGAIVGTIGYMAPEQLAGKLASNQTDAYSAGAVIYQMLTGVMPFDGASFTELAHSIRHEPFKPITDFRKDVPEALIELIESLLSKDPEDRPKPGAALKRLSEIAVG